MNVHYYPNTCFYSGKKTDGQRCMCENNPELEMRLGINYCLS